MLPGRAAYIFVLTCLAAPAPGDAQPPRTGANPACQVGSDATSAYHLKDASLDPNSLIISTTDDSAALIDRISTGADGLLINRQLSRFRGAAGSAGLYHVYPGGANTPYCIPRSGIIMSAHFCAHAGGVCDCCSCHSTQISPLSAPAFWLVLVPQ